MKTNVKISVVMGVFNPQDSGRFFRAVDSVIQQSFSEWELILYDDGSAAESAKTIQKAAERDRRILLLRGEKNRGLAFALNECIRHAAGGYIARMDDDDFSKPDRFRKQYDFLQAYPQYQWVGSDIELVDQNGVWGYQKMPEAPSKRDYLFNSPYVHPSVLFRREALERVGCYSGHKAVLQCEDYDLFLRLQKEGMRGYNLPEPLLQYWEDYESYKKRTYRRRIREMKLRYRGFRELGILNRGTFPYVVKPLLVGAIPAPVHHYIKRKIRRPKKEERARG